VTSGWDLFGYGPDGLVRIQLERGRVTRTAIPPLDSTGPVSLVAGPDQAVIRPLDVVTGYLVPDGRPARRLPGPLRHGGVVMPGPTPGNVWVLSADSTVIRWYSLLSGSSGTPVRLPAGMWLVAADGRGGALLQNADGSFYDAGPGGVRPVPAVSVLAVGPARWLEVSCRPRGPCADLASDPAGGPGRRLPGRATGTTGQVGAVSPDGSVAAVFQSGPGGQVRLRLISLTTGAARTLPVVVRGPLGSQALAWSPDGRWLFTVARDGQLRAVDARTGQLRGLGVTLPPLVDLAVRYAPAKAR
jgi:hypothetical protein